MNSDPSIRCRACGRTFEGCKCQGFVASREPAFVVDRLVRVTEQKK